MSRVRFFCEQCGAQTRPRDRICRNCGSFFSNVRCPVCGFQGEVSLFLHGCPACGYTGDLGGKAKPKKDLSAQTDQDPLAAEPEVGSGWAKHIPLVVSISLFGLTFLILVIIFIVTKH